MTIEVTGPTEAEVTCSNCKACCCRLLVFLISETGVPAHFIDTDKWGGMSMAQLEDGWCAALDRNTLMCTIYEQRPQVCRDFEMGSYECIVERKSNM